jgi:hypothetical protein
MRMLDADFNMLDEHGRFWLPNADSATARLGEQVMLTDGDLEIPVTLDYDESRAVWVGVPIATSSDVGSTVLGSS